MDDRTPDYEPPGIEHRERLRARLELAGDDSIGSPIGDDARA